jgi:hypothetical protein
VKGARVVVATAVSVTGVVATAVTVATATMVRVAVTKLVAAVSALISVITCRDFPAVIFRA